MKRTRALFSVSILLLLTLASFASATSPVLAPCEPSAIASSIQNAIIEKYPFHADDYISDIQLANDVCKTIETGQGTLEYGIYYVTMHGKTQDTHYTVTREGFDFEIVAGIPGPIKENPYDKIQAIFSLLERQKLDFQLQQLIYGVEKNNERDKLIWVAAYPQSNVGMYGDAIIGEIESPPVAIASNPVGGAIQTPASAPEIVDDAPAITPTVDAGSGNTGVSGNPVQVVATNDTVVSRAFIDVPEAKPIDCATFRQAFSSLVQEVQPLNHYYYSEKSNPYCVGLIQTPISKVRALLRSDIPLMGYFGEKINFNALVRVPVSYTEEEFVKLAQKIGQGTVAFTPAGVYIRLYEHISDNDALFLSIYSHYEQPRAGATVNATIEASYYGMQADAHLDEMNARITQRLQELGFQSSFKITPAMKRDPYYGSEPPTVQRENTTTYTDYYYTGTIALPNDLLERVAGWDQTNDPTQVTYAKNGNVVILTKHRMEFHGGDLPNQNSYSVILTPDTILGIFQLGEADSEVAYAKLKGILSPYMDAPAPESISFIPYGDYGVVYSTLSQEKGITDATTTTTGGLPADSTPGIFDARGTLEQFTGASPDNQLIENPFAGNNSLVGGFSNIFLVLGVMAVVGIALWFVVRPH